MSYRSVWIDNDEPDIVKIIDQASLPFSFNICNLRSVEDVYDAIADMKVRGAPAIGVAGAFGMYLATLEITVRTNIREHLHNAARYLSSCRPTAINLSLAVTKVLNSIFSEDLSRKEDISRKALLVAQEISDNEINNCKEIGRYGLEIIRKISLQKNGGSVNILTHCNAGWLACVDLGTVTAPVYMARDKGIPVHVWVDETRPRNQGARLTCFELANEEIPHTLITDNAGGYLMQKGMVDIVLTGTDRITRSGDCANKTGTYLKALAASDNNIPFYVAAPSTSFDLNISNGIDSIPIEERDAEEVTEIEGIAGGRVIRVRICPENTKASNYGFDITPARLIKGLITEKGIINANESDIVNLFN